MNKFKQSDHGDVMIGCKKDGLWFRGQRRRVYKKFAEVYKMM